MNHFLLFDVKSMFIHLNGFISNYSVLNKYTVYMAKTVLF